MEKIQLWDDATITQNTAIEKIIQIPEDWAPTVAWNDTGAAIVVPFSIQANFVGGTITITFAWTIDGINWVAQAFADGDGDVSIIASATGTCWDVALLPVIPTAVKVTVTETNVAATTRLDATLSF